MTTGKFCNGCDRYLRFIEFSPDSRNHDGLQGRCRDCRNSTRRTTPNAWEVARAEHTLTQREQATTPTAAEVDAEVERRLRVLAELQGD